MALELHGISKEAIQSHTLLHSCHLLADGPALAHRTHTVRRHADDDDERYHLRWGLDWRCSLHEASSGLEAGARLSWRLTAHRARIVAPLKMISWRRPAQHP